MRRIVVIAAGPAGISAATRIKRRLPEHEVNVIIPAAVAGTQDAFGPAGRRRNLALPNLETLASREVGILEAQDIMPDLAEGEITVSSSRGSLPIRYTDLVLEVPATVRLPRALHKAANVFSWPMPGFAADPGPCDAALAEAAASNSPVLVVGSGVSALDAVCLALEAGAKVRWLRVKESESPAVETQLDALLLRFFGPDVLRIDCPDIAADRLGLGLNADGTRLERVILPDGSEYDAACSIWTTPLMGRHPILREPGVILDAQGRISLSDDRPEGPPLVLMGSGAAVPGAVLPVSGCALPAWPGGSEAAEFSAWTALDTVVAVVAAVAADGKQAPAPGNGTLAVREAMLCLPGENAARNLRLQRAGLSLAEAQALGRDAEYAIVSSRDGAFALGACDSLVRDAEIILALTVDRPSRTLLGVQVLGLGPVADLGDGLFGLALAALAEGVRLDTPARRPALGLCSRMFAAACAIVCNKLDTLIKGVTPDEFLTSRQAGAEFFTLDLRSLPDWREGRVPGAYNIPLPQLKKRLQDEVPRFTPLVLVSADGRDAYAVACRLAGLGATDLYVLDGGMRLWPYETERGGSV
ncbi:MAG: rhodanese-like domain-containing protein [Desulfovibrionaceae bacterium]|nr:rhodanese-like domain-containing protein [Desulfovibrionaceae bacterium]